MLTSSLSVAVTYLVGGVCSSRARAETFIAAPSSVTHALRPDSRMTHVTLGTSTRSQLGHNRPVSLTGGGKSKQERRARWAKACQHDNAECWSALSAHCAGQTQSLPLFILFSLD